MDEAEFRDDEIKEPEDLDETHLPKTDGVEDDEMFDGDVESLDDLRDKEEDEDDEVDFEDHEEEEMI